MKLFPMLLAGGGSQGYIPNAVKFDGTNDYLTRGAALTGVSDSSTGVFSCWVRPNSASTYSLLNSFTGVYTILSITFDYTGLVSVTVVSGAGGGSSLSFDSTATGGVAYNPSIWYNILASWNTNYSAGNKLAQLYINDANVFSSKADSSAAFNAGYASGTQWNVAANYVFNKSNCQLSELYFAPGQYLDFSVTANRRKFIDANGLPVSLGADGSTPTGTSPAIYLKGDKTAFGTNSGTGGNFTLTGALETASTDPSIPNISTGLAGTGVPANVVNAVKYDGSTSHLTIPSLTGASDSYTGILSMWVRGDLINTTEDLMVFSNSLVQFNGGLLNVVMRNSAGSSTFSFKATSAYITTNPNWIHILASWDTNHAAGAKVGQLYLNNISNYTLLSDTASAFQVAYSAISYDIGANGTTAWFNGAISELYFAPGQYLDLSNAANRAKFIDSNGNPVYLGANGELPTGTAPAIYLNNRAATIGTNKGTGGNFTVNGTVVDANSTPLYYYSEPSQFDGTNDYLTRGAALTGVSDGATGTISFWIRLDAAVSTHIISNTPWTFEVAWNGAGAGNKEFEFFIYDTGNANYLGLRSSPTIYSAPSNWVHVIASWDANYSAGNKLKHLYINDVSDLAISSDASPAFVVDYTSTNWAISATTAGAGKFNGCISDLYFSTSYLDLSVTANRRKFITADKRPVFLGKDGSLPTGTAPAIYLANPYSSFQTNLGTGGNFTVTGALTRGSTSASDVKA